MTAKAYSAGLMIRPPTFRILSVPRTCTPSKGRVSAAPAATPAARSAAVGAWCGEEVERPRMAVA